MPNLFLDSDIVSIDIEVGDVSKTLLKFDRIEVWRSPDNVIPYIEITSDDDTSATVIGTVDGPWILTGTSLNISLNDATPLVITFTEVSTDLLSLITKINNVVPGIASQVGPNINRIKLSSNLIGLLSSIQISGIAASILGLSTIRTIGAAHRIELIEPTTRYKFYDVDGLFSYYYKIRFRNSVNGALSPYSTIIRATPPQNLANSDLVTASVKLSNATGIPIEGRRIILVPIIITQISSNGLLSTQDRIVIKTDQFGFASTKIAKGIRLRIFFEGTGFEREILVPNIDFDILQAATTYPDPFNIVSTPPMPIRTI